MLFAGFFCMLNSNWQLCVFLIILTWLFVPVYKQFEQRWHTKLHSWPSFNILGDIYNIINLAKTFNMSLIFTSFCWPFLPLKIKNDTNKWISRVKVCLLSCMKIFPMSSLGLWRWGGALVAHDIRQTPSLIVSLFRLPLLLGSWSFRPTELHIGNIETIENNILYNNTLYDCS